MKILRIKIREKLMNSSSPLKLSQEYQNTVFIEHYFSESAKKYKIDLWKFHPPTNNKKLTFFKTICRDFLKMIQLSPEFKKDFESALNFVFSKNEILRKTTEEFQRKYISMFHRTSDQDSVKKIIH